MLRISTRSKVVEQPSFSDCYEQEAIFH